MIDIEAAGLLYCNIKQMYKTGHGYGLQLDKELEQVRGKIKNACDKIAEDVYGLQDILEEHQTGGQHGHTTSNV